MLNVLKTNVINSDFIKLTKLLDDDLAERDGNEHEFYSRYNKMDNKHYAILVRMDEVPIACGAMKRYNSNTMEIKRMYTLEDHRRKGIAKRVLLELEKWARDLGYEKCIMETGLRQPEAIKLYESQGYTQTENYGPYVGVSNSVCYEKSL